MQSLQRYPRIRTGIIPCDGGLEYKKQFVRVGILPPQMKDGQVLSTKNFISSVMSEKDGGKPDEALSIRFGDKYEMLSFFVAEVLAIRIYGKITGKDLKEELKKRIDAAWEGCYDLQIQPFSMRERI